MQLQAKIKDPIQNVHQILAPSLEQQFGQNLFIIIYTGCPKKSFGLLNLNNFANF